MMQGNAPCQHIDGEFCVLCYPPHKFSVCEHGIETLLAHCPECLKLKETLKLCKHNRPARIGCSKCFTETYDLTPKLPSCIHGLVDHCKICDKKEETITIKKALWDEMIGYKRDIELLKDSYQGFFHEISDIEKRMENFQSAKIHDSLKNFEDRIEKLEIILGKTRKNQKEMKQVYNAGLSAAEKRLEKLENSFDLKKAELLIYEGAQTHLSIIKLESKVKELEKDMAHNRVESWQNIDELEKTISNLANESDKRCFACRKDIKLQDVEIAYNLTGKVYCSPACLSKSMLGDLKCDG